MVQRRIVSRVLALLCLAQFSALGEIAFNPPQSYTVSANPIWVVADDFNHDGKRDLAVITLGDSSVGDPGGVSILFGNGDGTFQSAKNSLIGKSGNSAVAGDFDGDGNQDLALLRAGDASAGDDGDVTILLGNGDGTFRQGQVLTPGKNPSSKHSSIAAVDLNGDQRLDLVVANSGDKTFSVMLGNGNGTFQSPVAYPVVNPAQSLFVADLAGNGEKDMVVFGIDIVQTWLSNGDGTFRQASHLLANGILVGDFNEDKKADLVVKSFSLNCIFKCSPGSGGGTITDSLLLGNGDGTFQPAIGAGLVVGAGDFDGDGKLDLVGSVPSQIHIFLGNGDGTFQPPVAFDLDGVLTEVLDVNADTAPDLITLADNNIGLLVNVGTDFSISASSLSMKTLTPGQSATSTLTLQLLSNFNNPVTLTCAVQPAQPGAPTCSLSPSSVTFDADGKGSSSLTINAASSASLRRDFRPLFALLFPFIGVAFLETGFRAGERTKRLRMTLVVGAVLFACAAAQMACGGGASVAKSVNYTVAVTASSGPTQHSAKVTIQAQ